MSKIVNASLIIALVAILWIILPSRKITEDLEVMRQDGYIGEIHHVTTEDGYILGITRITAKVSERNQLNGKEGVVNSSSKRLPVLLVHGLQASSIEWIYILGNSSLPYLLFEEGYDVWMINCRGTFRSQKHISPEIESDKEKFFDISLHDIGYFDLPATVDYILEETKFEKLFYVGMSQGEATFLIMTSTRPEYNEKIRLASLLAPSSHVKYSKNTVLKNMGTIWPHVQSVFAAFGKYDMSMRSLSIPLCKFEIFHQVCQRAMSNLLGYFTEPIEKETYNRIMEIHPVMSSMKQIAHYGQLFQTGKFRNFDYGGHGNIQRYGTPEPPEYDLKKISAPVAVYSAENDCWSTPEDVRELVSELPNVVRHYVVPDRKFHHVAFMIDKNVKTLVYDKVIDRIKDFSSSAKTSVS